MLCYSFDLEQFESELCIENVCQCENGEPYSHDDFDNSGLYRPKAMSFCDANNANRCAKCDAGFSLFENECV